MSVPSSASPRCANGQSHLAAGQTEAEVIRRVGQCVGDNAAAYPDRDLILISPARATTVMTPVPRANI